MVAHGSRTAAGRRAVCTLVVLATVSLASACTSVTDTGTVSDNAPPAQVPVRRGAASVEEAYEGFISATLRGDDAALKELTEPPGSLTSQGLRADHFGLGEPLTEPVSIEVSEVLESGDIPASDTVLRLEVVRSDTGLRVGGIILYIGTRSGEWVADGRYYITGVGASD